MKRRSFIKKCLSGLSAAPFAGALLGATKAVGVRLWPFQAAFFAGDIDAVGGLHSGAEPWTNRYATLRSFVDHKTNEFVMQMWSEEGELESETRSKLYPLGDPPEELPAVMGVKTGGEKSNIEVEWFGK